jgi:hypothetical protein
MDARLQASTTAKESGAIRAVAVEHHGRGVAAVVGSERRCVVYLFRARWTCGATAAEPTAVLVGVEEQGLCVLFAKHLRKNSSSKDTVTATTSAKLRIMARFLPVPGVEEDDVGWGRPSKVYRCCMCSRRRQIFVELRAELKEGRRSKVGDRRRHGGQVSKKSYFARFSLLCLG